MTTNAGSKERDEAISRLRGMLTPGDHVYTTLKHVSRSGMFRVIEIYIMINNRPYNISWLVCRALGYKYNDRHSGLPMTGCGYDVGFGAIYNLGYTLFPDWECLGKTCHSPDHYNSDTRLLFAGYDKPHRDGGYSLLHEWL